MSPQALAVDSTSSFAYRRANEVHLVVQIPDLDVADGPLTLRLRHGDRRFRRPASITRTEQGARLEATVPAARLGRVPWNLAIQPVQPGPFVRVQARLLSHPRRPVALLPGPAPRITLAVPGPRPAPALLRGARAGKRLAGRLSRPVRRRFGP